MMALRGGISLLVAVLVASLSGTFASECETRKQFLFLRDCKFVKLGICLADPETSLRRSRSL